MHKVHAEVQTKDPANGRVIAVASSNLTDRHGEIVSVEGWDFENFEKQPRILWSHDHYIPAIGKAVKIWVEGKGKRAKLMFEAEFQEVTEFGKQAKQLIMDGWIDTFSVGFKAEEMEGNTYTSQELLEISLVNVPANTDAQVVAYKALCEAGVCENDMRRIGIEPMFVNLKSQVDKMDLKLESAVKALATVNPQKGRSAVTKNRLAFGKVIVRTADQILADKKGLPIKTVKHAKVMKRAAENMLQSVKKDLDG